MLHAVLKYYLCFYTDLRIAGGDGYYYGRLEICYGGEWGTVCDDWFGSEELSVVCRQLGFSTPYTYYTGATYGQGCGPVFIDDLDCSGDEERLEHCFHRSVCSTNCDHSQDVAVYCYCKLPIITVFP